MRRPSSQLLPGMEYDDPVGILRSQVEVVHNGQDTCSLACKALSGREDAVLMRQIETRRGLVEQQIALPRWWYVPYLRQDTRELDALPLAA